MAAWSTALNSHREQQDPLWLKQIGGLTGMLGRAPTLLSLRSQTLANNEAARCRSFAKGPARPRQCLAGEGSSSEGFRQQQELPWQQFFLGPTLLWESRQHKKISRSPDSRRKGPHEVLRFNNCNEPALVDEQVAAVDMHEDAQEVKRLCQEGPVELAVKALDLLHQRGITLSLEVYGCILHACSRKKALAEARKVHELIAGTVYKSDDHLNNLLVDIYIKCGSLTDALKSFDRLLKRNVISWTALISGYTTDGQYTKAVRVYKEMQNAGVKPDRHTFVSVLKACGSSENLEDANWLHAEVVQNKYGNDLFVGASLVSMYAKCGSLEKALDVFQQLPHRDVTVCNALLAGYCQQELYGKALQLYTDMQVQGVRPNHRTFPSVLKACSSLAAKEKDSVVDRQPVKAQYLTKGRDIHAEVLKQGHELDEFVGNTLVHMYAQCGDTLSARDVFDRLVNRNIVAWNALIGGYAEHNQGDYAFGLFAEMIGEGMRPTTRTFASILKACGTLAATEETMIIDDRSWRMRSLVQGKKVHAEVVRMAYDSDVFVGSALVYMYAKCGDLDAARHVFDTLAEQNIVSWNAMIAGYVQQGKAQEGLKLFLRMERDGVQPDSWTLASALKACCHLAEEGSGELQRLLALQIGKEIHATVGRSEYRLDAFLGNSLVEMYTKCGSLIDARLAFDSSAQVDLIAWNAMITGYSEHKQFEHALEVYSEVRNAGLTPDSWVLASVLKATWCLADFDIDTPMNGQLVKVESLRIGEEIHAEVVKHGHESDVVVAAALINMYARCGDMVQARRVFDNMCHRDATSFTAIIAGYTEHDDADKNFHVYGLMLESGVRPDQVTYMCLLKAFSNVGALKMCRWIHDDIIATGKDWGPNVTTSLIHAYCKCSSLLEAQHVFDTFPHRNLGAWNALIAGHARQGDYVTSLELFEQLKTAGLEPDGVSFLCVLAACSHSGMVDKGLHLFKSMTNDYGIAITCQHCTCLVDLLGRAGHLKEVEGLLQRIPNQPDLTTWLSLLGACRKYNDVQTARRAFERAVSLQPKHSAAYVLMSSTYSQADMWEDAENMESSRQRAGAWKKPGQSWIEHEKKVHKFVVGDRSYQQSEQIKLLVIKLRVQMEQR